MRFADFSRGYATFSELSGQYCTYRITVCETYSTSSFQISDKLLQFEKKRRHKGCGVSDGIECSKEDDRIPPLKSNR